MAPPLVVLLDLDGTLVDSNDAHAQAWLETFERNGYAADFETIRKLIGEGGDKLVPNVTSLPAHSREAEELSEACGNLFKKRYLPQIRAFPRTAQLLRRMRDTGLRLVVASSAKSELVDSLLEICSGRGLIEEEASSQDAQRSKPDPDIIQAALRKARCAPHEAVMLGDTPYDVVAAAKAGVRCIAVRCGGHADAELAGAFAIYDDPADLLAHFQQSIFAGCATETQ